MGNWSLSVHRTAAIWIAALLVALVMLWGRFGSGVSPAAGEPNWQAASSSAAAGWVVAAPTARAEAIEFRRDEVDPVRDAAPPEAAAELTFLLTGACKDELNGIAFVRRKDGSATEVPFSGGRLTAADRSSLDGVSLRVPGFAIAWPKLDRAVATIDVPMQRAGTLRVRLVDTAGRPLAHRALGTICQELTNAVPPGVGYSGNVRGVTGLDGVARIEHVVPGKYEVFAARVAEWQPAVQRGLVVRVGETTECELVAPIPAPDRFGGFRLSRAEAPMLKGFENDVHSHVFATREGHQYMLSILGDEVRCAVQGRPGELVTGSITPVDCTGSGQLLPPVSVPITVTVGAFVDWQPIWIR
jgi:hypothetical protein